MIYNEKNVSKIIKFDLLKLEKNTKKKSPLNLLYDIVIEELGGLPKNKKFNPNCVYVTRTTNTILEYIFKKWIRKYYKEVHPARLNATVAMEFLNLGPMSFQDNHHWMNNDTAYIIGDLYS